jgi:hypothetical protein
MLSYVFCFLPVWKAHYEPIFNRITTYLVKLKGVGQIGECFFLLWFLSCPLFCATPNKLEKESVGHSPQWHPLTDKQTHLCWVCVCFIFSHDTWKISAGYHGKQTKACVSKNEMLAQVGIILLKYHRKLVTLGGMDDKWDGWQTTNLTKRKRRNV